jgi:lysyl-tRNA synthetase class 2
LATQNERTAEELDAEKPRVKIAGRIQTVRRMGKAGFMHLSQSGERLQVYVRKDAVSEREYAFYTLLDIGDIIGVEGYLFRTRTGELSVFLSDRTSDQVFQSRE